ncbi:hypothetical protein MPER_03691 [Moniliophthora perniciosa FA553]|nr:hypothetical protein MPER_03691 [Moniliophthora perniciosa FA553]
MMMEIYTYGNNMVNLNLGALEIISNAILYDTRVFHIPSPSWLPKFNQQESQIRNAWTTAGPDKVFQEAENRLLREGWDKSNHISEVEYLGRVIEVIEWGQKVWKDVDFSSRGAIFRDTFLRGVQRLHMEALTQVGSETFCVEVI